MIEPGFTYLVAVERVIDGDTYRLSIDLGFSIFVSETVRLARIDCPEMWTAEGPGVADWVRERFQKAGRVVIETRKTKPGTYRRDRYGRYLAEVWIDGRNLADELLAAGLAKVWS